MTAERTDDFSSYMIIDRASTSSAEKVVEKTDESWTSDCDIVEQGYDVIIFRC